MPTITGIILIDVIIVAFIAGFFWTLGSHICSRVVTRGPTL